MHTYNTQTNTLNTEMYLKYTIKEMIITIQKKRNKKHTSLASRICISTKEKNTTYYKRKKTKKLQKICYIL